MGLKKEKRSWFKNQESVLLWYVYSVTCTKERREKETSKKDPNLGEGGKEKRMYVLDRMVVTCPTCQAEMLALKPLLLSKTLDISVTKEVSQSSIGP